MRSQIRAQLDALLILQQALDELEHHLQRLDQAGRLDDIRDMVEKEVQDVRRTETAAHCGFVEGSLVGGLAGFGLGSLLAARQNMEHPVAEGARLARKCLTGARPFGKIMVSVGPGGVFQQVEVIPLSRRARELHCSECDITASIQAQGCNLMTPEAFLYMIEKLKEQTLTGTDGST